jgi:hypothetical protein
MPAPLVHRPGHYGAAHAAPHRRCPACGRTGFVEWRAWEADDGREADLWYECVADRYGAAGGCGHGWFAKDGGGHDPARNAGAAQHAG